MEELPLLPKYQVAHEILNRVAQKLEGGPITTANLLPTFRMYLGASGNSHSHYEYGFISKPLATQELSDLESYLMAKGGIT